MRCTHVKRTASSGSISYLQLESNEFTGTVPSFASTVELSVYMTCVNDEKNSPRSPTCPLATGNATAANETAALNELFAAMNGTQWWSKSGWGTTSDPCQTLWTGVGCENTAPAHVTYVRLNFP